jgi:hypothetical protein
LILSIPFRSSLLDDLDVMLAVHLRHETFQQAIHKTRVKEAVARVVPPPLERVEV